jgi:hypothetical protein
MLQEHANRAEMTLRALLLVPNKSMQQGLASRVCMNKGADCGAQEVCASGLAYRVRDHTISVAGGALAICASEACVLEANNSVAGGA